MFRFRTISNENRALNLQNIRDPSAMNGEIIYYWNCSWQSVFLWEENEVYSFHAEVGGTEDAGWVRCKRNVDGGEQVDGEWDQYINFVRRCLCVCLLWIWHAMPRVLRAAWSAVQECIFFDFNAFLFDYIAYTYRLAWRGSYTLSSSSSPTSLARHIFTPDR